MCEKRCAIKDLQEFHWILYHQDRQPLLVHPKTRNHDDFSKENKHLARLITFDISPHLTRP